MRMKILCLFALSMLATQVAWALNYDIKLSSFPAEQELVRLKALKGNVALELCCSYPSPEQLSTLSKHNVKSLHIVAGYFPTSAELAGLEKSGLQYRITAEEAFPSAEEAARLNKSGIKLLTISGRDFPTQGEIQAYNMFTIPFRLEILKKEFPTYEHMIVIRQIKKEHQVAFHNPVPPGPGYADFFNALSAHKVFVITDKFPYGDDAIGLNMLTNSSVEVKPDQRLMPQDLPVLNAIQLNLTVSLHDHWPVDEQYMQMLGSLKASKLELFDDGQLQQHLSALELMSQQQGREINIGQSWY